MGQSMPLMLGPVDRSDSEYLELHLATLLHASVSLSIGRFDVVQRGLNRDLVISCEGKGASIACCTTQPLHVNCTSVVSRALSALA